MNNHRSACPDCANALLSDLLCRIQKQLIDHPDQPLPSGLACEIIRGGYQTLEDFKKQMDAKALKDSGRQLHNLARLDHMQRAGQEFDEQHPGNGGPTYAGKIN
jgi:hypothetical protein